LVALSSCERSATLIDRTQASPSSRTYYTSILDRSNPLLRTCIWLGWRSCWGYWIVGTPRSNEVLNRQITLAISLVVWAERLTLGKFFVFAPYLGGYPLNETYRPWLFIYFVWLSFSTSLGQVNLLNWPRSRNEASGQPSGSTSLHDQTEFYSIVWVFFLKAFRQRKNLCGYYASIFLRTSFLACHRHT